MQTDIIFAGFGGQGVLTAGKFLAEAALAEGKEVCWMPSYGPEMRGGTANCTVVISDKRVGSPIVASPQILVAMNLPSLDKFEPTVRPKGLIVFNSSLIHRTVGRTDLEVLAVPANQIAIEIGNPKVASIVVLGALCARRPLVTFETVVEKIKKTFGVKKPALVELNRRAFEAGLAAGRVGGASQ